MQLVYGEVMIESAQPASVFKRSALALAVLGLLEIEPMHPYKIQQLIKQWNKDEFINVGQRATLYKMIARLEAAGLVAEHGTSRDAQYPERTSYALTDAGREASREWLAEMLSTRRNEYPEFPAALSFMMVLKPARVAELLAARRVVVQTEIERIEGMFAYVQRIADNPRAALIESEYTLVLAAAERDWLDRVIADLGDGTFAWDSAHD